MSGPSFHGCVHGRNVVAGVSASSSGTVNINYNNEPNRDHCSSDTLSVNPRDNHVKNTVACLKSDGQSRVHVGNHTEFHYHGDPHKVTEEHLDIAKKQLKAQEDITKERLSKDEQECHQLFRLTTDNRDTTYEWYKDRVEERVEDTCMWFLKHEHFQMWLNQESGPLLVSADPGCGKSVLAKYLIDHGLPRSTTICSAPNSAISPSGLLRLPI